MAVKRTAITKKKKGPKGAKTSSRSKAKETTAVKKVSKDPAREYVLALQSKLKADKKSLLQIPTLTGDELPCLSHLGAFLSTQQPTLDRILGGRGLPFAKWIEVFGPEHVGKSTFLYHLFAEVQKCGGVGILADVEHSAIPDYASGVGVDTNKLLMLEFDRDALVLENIVDAMYESIRWWRATYPDMKVVLGWDALGSTRTQEEKDKNTEQGKKPGSTAKIMHLMKRKVVPELAGSNIMLVVLNHEYEIINTGGFGFGFGKKRETFGGGGQRLASAIRIKLFPKGFQKDSGGQYLTKQVGLEVVKDKIFGSFRFPLELCLIPGQGFVPEWPVYKELVARKVIATSGSWAALDLDGEKLSFQGWLGLRRKCDEDPTLFPRLLKVYWSLVGG